MQTAFVFSPRILKYFSYLGLLVIELDTAANNFRQNYGLNIEKIKINKLESEIFKYLAEIKATDKKNKSKKGKVINLFLRNNQRQRTQFVVSGLFCLN